MYGAALFILIMTAALIYGLITALAGLTAVPREGRAKAYCARIFGALFMVFRGVSAFVGRWIFLVGYLEVAKEL